MRVGSFVSWVRSQASNLIVFAVLGTVMWLGHHFDWKLPPFTSANADVDPRMEYTPTPVVPSVAAAPVGGDVKSLTSRIKFASPETLAKANIKLGDVVATAIPEYVQANGSLDYVKTRMAQLSTRAPGVVWQVLAKVGDNVNEGDTLAIVESVDVGKAKSDFLQAVVQFELKQKMLDVSRKLEATVAQKEIVEMESRVREARIQMVNAQQTLINLGLPIDLASCHGLCDDDMIRRLHTLGLPTDWAVKFEPSRTTANLVPLKAPFSGQIIGTDLVKGEAISPGQTKIVIANTSAMWVVLDVGIEDAVRCRIGQQMRFRPDGLRDAEITSAISWISTEADPKTRRVQMRAEVKNPTGVLRANTFGAGRIKVRDEMNALAVSADALHWDMDAKKHLVFVAIDSQTFEPRHVRCGTRSDKVCEVFGDLRPGDKIAVEGSYLLKSELLKIRMASSK